MSAQQHLATAKAFAFRVAAFIYSVLFAAFVWIAVGALKLNKLAQDRYPEHHKRAAKVWADWQPTVEGAYNYVAAVVVEHVAPLARRADTKFAQGRVEPTLLSAVEDCKASFTSAREANRI